MKKNELKEYDCYFYLKKKGIDKDKIKGYVNFTSFYFSELLDNHSSINDFYLNFVKRELNKDSLIYRVMVNNEKKKDIANEIGITEASMYNYFLETKKSIREKYKYYSKFSDYDFDEIIEYLEFNEMFFKDKNLVIDEFYKQYVDYCLETNSNLKVIFKENLSLRDYAKNINKTKSMVAATIAYLKEKINKEYEILIKYRQFEFKEVLMAIHFNEYYSLNQDNINQEYIDFVIKEIENDELMELYFKEGIIKKETNTVLNNKRKKIMEDYDLRYLHSYRKRKS